MSKRIKLEDGEELTLKQAVYCLQAAQAQRETIEKVREWVKKNSNDDLFGTFSRVDTDDLLSYLEELDKGETENGK